VRFFLDGGKDGLEAADIGAGEAAGDRLLELGEVLVNAQRRAAAARGRRNQERAPVVGADVARDEAAVGQPIENARQRRAFVRQATMEVGNRRRPRGREQREDMRLALRQPVVTQVREIQADPMGCPMDRRHETQRQ